MSIRTGNEKFRAGNYQLAIKEYEKVGSTSGMYKAAQFNIRVCRKYLGGRSETRTVRKRRPLLSIVMPVFNVGPYLDASILSVLHQSYQNIELIIVDDASTDEGASIIEMYRRLDSRVKVIKMPHNTLGGAGIPSNAGMDAATGEYIGFVDSDDFVSYQAFETLVNRAMECSADVVIGDFNNFDQDTRKVDDAYDKHAWDKLPLEEAFSPADYPEVYRLSPVPWRKLYKRDFMNRYQIRYPEGDYFYEDNPLHWLVLSRAERVALSDKVIAYHRMARAGQTMGSSTYKLSALCSHLNTVGKELARNKSALSQRTVDEFYDYLYRQAWVIDRQECPRVKEIVKKQFSRIYQRYLPQIPHKEVRKGYTQRFSQYKASYQDLDLTIVIPTYNCADLIADTINSLKKIKKIKFNVLIMDDGSTDSTYELLKQMEAEAPNIHVFQQGNKGAGRARNALIPLCTGTYTYFLDADDYVYAEALEAAVMQARKDDNDLLLFKYQIENFEEKQQRELFNADKDVWDRMMRDRNNIAAEAVKLINYPWVRIIKTNLLHDENIYFGATVVHNDIPFHWHSLATARNIGLLDKAVCVHRKFSARSQITNISDARRMTVLEALRYTQEKIRKSATDDRFSSSWRKFSQHILEWAQDRVPVELRDDFSKLSKEFLAKPL